MSGDSARSGDPGGQFTARFDRAATRCGHAQALLVGCAEAAARARVMRQSSRRVRRRAGETLKAWRGAELSNAAMRLCVDDVAGAMHDAGMARDDASAAVRARIRYVLYDGGMRERDAEPVVARASDWVDVTYAGRATRAAP